MKNNNFPHFWKVCHIQPCVDDLTLQVINYPMHRASRSECISMICNKIYIGVIFLMKLQPFENGTQNCGLDIQAIAPNLLIFKGKKEHDQEVLLYQMAIPT